MPLRSGSGRSRGPGLAASAAPGVARFVRRELSAPWSRRVVIVIVSAQLIGPIHSIESITGQFHLDHHDLRQAKLPLVHQGDNAL
jgi:hypothetical protein